MNKELEALKRLKGGNLLHTSSLYIDKCIDLETKTKYNNEIKDDYKTIEQALLKKKKLEKAIKLGKNKNLFDDLMYIINCGDEYKEEFERFFNISEEEFDLLKEVFRNV